MSPRKYDMNKRSAAVQETRRRIVEATLELHTAQGILATSWEDIAKRADVAVGTVYRHFPSLDELMPACGELSMKRLALPSEQEIGERFPDAGNRCERARWLVEELFAIYERAAPDIRGVRRERDKLAGLQKVHEYIEGVIDALVRTALAPLHIDEPELRVVRALTDVDTWQALRTRGIHADEAVNATAELLDCWLTRRQRTSAEWELLTADRAATDNPMTNSGQSDDPLHDPR